MVAKLVLVASLAVEAKAAAKLAVKLVAKAVAVVAKAVVRVVANLVAKLVEVARLVVNPVANPVARGQAANLGLAAEHVAPGEDGVEQTLDPATRTSLTLGTLISGLSTTAKVCSRRSA